MGSSFLGIRGFCQRQEKQNAQKKSTFDVAAPPCRKGGLASVPVDRQPSYSLCPPRISWLDGVARGFSLV
jgi:hypothetical protein